MSAKKKKQPPAPNDEVQDLPGITEKEIVCAVLNYFLNEKHISTSQVKEFFKITQPTAKSIISKEQTPHGKTISTVIKNTDSYLSGHAAMNKEFYTKIAGYLKDEGFNYEICLIYLSGEGSFSDRVQSLITNYNKNPGPLSYLSIDSIIARLRSLCQNYPGFFSPTQKQQLMIPQMDGFDSSRIIREVFSDNNPRKSLFKNYLILTFPTNYRVAVILINDFGSANEKKNAFLEKLKKSNSISMFIIFTDRRISRSEENELMEKYNIFFERVRERDFNESSLTNIGFHDYSMGSELLKSWFYAQVIMDRLITYFSIIRTEVVYRSYPGIDIGEEAKKLSREDYFTDFADKIIVKKFYNYSYNTRQAIRFERDQILREAENLAAKRADGKLDLVVELCAPNALLSAPLHSFSKKMMLFSSSQKAIRRFNSLKQQNLRDCEKHQQSAVFPQNIHFYQTHPDTDYITRNYFTSDRQDTSNAVKADIVILGLGMGSTISNLRNHLRSINLWLKDDGIVILSFVNKESILLQKDLSPFAGFERKPLIYSNVWQMELADSKKFLNRTTAYDANTIRWIMEDYTPNIDFYSYPNLLTLAPQDTEHSRLHNLGVLDRYQAMQEHDDYRKLLEEKNSRNQNQGDSSSLSLKGMFSGHYLYAIGFKKTASEKSEQCLRIINERLDFQLQGEFQRHPHKYTEDSRGLYNSLLESEVDMHNSILLKTVILKPEREKNEEIIYCILPYDVDIQLDRKKYHLCEEKFINEYFGTGSISPLVVFADHLLPNHKTRISCVNINQMQEATVIMPGCKNTEAISMSRNKFLEILPTGTEKISSSELNIQLARI